MEPVVTLTGRHLEAFLAYLAADHTRDEIREVKIAIDEGGVKLKINRGTWTRALGSMVE